MKEQDTDTKRRAIFGGRTLAEEQTAQAKAAEQEAQEKEYRKRADKMKFGGILIMTLGAGGIFSWVPDFLVAPIGIKPNSGPPWWVMFVGLVVFFLGQFMYAAGKNNEKIRRRNETRMDKVGHGTWELKK